MDLPLVSSVWVGFEPILKFGFFPCILHYKPKKIGDAFSRHFLDLTKNKNGLKLYPKHEFKGLHPWGATSTKTTRASDQCRYLFLAFSIDFGSWCFHCSSDCSLAHPKQLSFLGFQIVWQAETPRLRTLCALHF